MKLIGNQYYVCKDNNISITGLSKVINIVSASAVNQSLITIQGVSKGTT